MWSDELVKIVQIWVNKCKFEYNLFRLQEFSIWYYVGENIYWSISKFEIIIELLVCYQLLKVNMLYMYL